MKAGQWDPKQKKVVTNRIPKPEPGLNQLIVKITSASLCHTDIMAIDRPDVEEPFTLGHEGAGIIDQLHPSAEGKGYKVGDSIGFLYILGCCFECEACMVHNRLCLKGNPEMQGWTQPGFFSEYAIVDYRNAIHLPKSWSLKTSSVFFCAGVTGTIPRTSSQKPCIDISSLPCHRFLRSTTRPVVGSCRSRRARSTCSTVC
jgi:propanol-preferring alcohol dehydrogenase